MEASNDAVDGPRGRVLCCRPGSEEHLVREAQDSGVIATVAGPGLVLVSTREGASANARPAGGWAFADADLGGAVEVGGASVNAHAATLAEWFGENVRGEAVAAPWPCVFTAAGDEPGLARRAAAVERAFAEQLKRRLGRLARLATPQRPVGRGPARGLFVVFTGFDRALVAREAWLGGQRRMADDSQAPSRSYLKIEEAYGLLGSAPQPGQTVCDLGAAPGGWTWSAAKRGARVTAVDNGPLKGGALDHPLVEHLHQDAFAYRPRESQVCDWLFCDLVEEPHHVLRGVVEPWLAGRWCRRFVVNLKFGRTDPPALLRELRAPGSALARHAGGAVIAVLHHNRDEFTVAGLRT
jgi:23S rRNA (cytidine2498-2'-O)-methyltransferase